MNKYYLVQYPTDKVIKPTIYKKPPKITAAPTEEPLPGLFVYGPDVPKVLVFNTLEEAIDTIITYNKSTDLSKLKILDKQIKI